MFQHLVTPLWLSFRSVLSLLSYNARLMVLWRIHTSQSTFVTADQMPANKQTKKHVVFHRLHGVKCLLADANLEQIQCWLFYIAANQFYKPHHSSLHISMSFPLSLLHLFSVYSVVYENHLTPEHSFNDGCRSDTHTVPSSGKHVLPDWSDWEYAVTYVFICSTFESIDT